MQTSLSINHKYSFEYDSATSSLYCDRYFSFEPVAILGTTQLDIEFIDIGRMSNK